MRTSCISLSILGVIGAQAPAAHSQGPSQPPISVDREALEMFFKEPAAWKAWSEPWLRKRHTLMLTLDAFKRMEAEGDRAAIFRDLRLAASMGNVYAMIALTAMGSEALGLKGIGLRGNGGTEVDAVEALGWLNLALATPLGPQERLVPEFQRVLTDLESQLRERDPKFLDRATWAKVAAWEPPSPAYSDLKQAAEAGDTRAQATLGWGLLTGAPKEGTARSAQVAEAQSLCWRAATQGHLRAQLQYAAAFLTEDALGTPATRTRARDLLSLLNGAAEEGSVQAMETLSTLVFKYGQDPQWDRIFPISDSVAMALALKAAKAGQPRAMAVYAGFRLRPHREGEELLPEHILEARAWLALAGGREPRLQPMAITLEAQARTRDLENRSAFDPRSDLWAQAPEGHLPPAVPRFPRKISGER